MKVMINGFGRIGRLVLRSMLSRHLETFEIVAINDLVSADYLAYLLKYDSVHGRASFPVTHEGNHLIAAGRKIPVFSETNPENLPLKDLKVDFVVEATGRFTEFSEAEKLRRAGAKKVIITAPAKGDVPTFVMGVNHETYDPDLHHVVSNASCTTNCLAPLTKVLLDHFGIEEGLMTTVHALTASQLTVDGVSKKDRREGRAAGVNLIPSSTGAAKAVGLCLPAVKGKLTGMSLRVPTADVSVLDLTVRLAKNTSYEEICEAVRQASLHNLKGIIEYCEEEAVSSDFIGSTASCIFDKGAGIALNPRFYKLIAWYDNETGYSERVLDLIRYMASRE